MTKTPSSPPRRLLLQRTGPAFQPRDWADYAHVERRILREAYDLLAEHIPQQSAAVRHALLQALDLR